MHEPHIVVRRARPDARPFSVEMARLACVIEDRPLPQPESSDVRGMLPSPEDVALLAVDDNARPVGAAWWLFHDPPLLRGADGRPLPEMVIAVTAGVRSRGVGTALIAALTAEARTHFPALSLNVHLRNPAARLSTRTGFDVAGKGRGRFGVALVRAFAATRDDPETPTHV